MQDPLREIFQLIYEEKIACHPMTKEEHAVWDRAQAVLGETEIDEMLDAQSRSLVECQYDYFRAGIRLGIRLMLELK